VILAVYELFVGSIIHQEVMKITYIHTSGILFITWSIYMQSILWPKLLTYYHWFTYVV